MNDRNSQPNSPEDDDLLIIEDEGEVPAPGTTNRAGSEPAWKMMLVDDDPDVHRATKLILKNVTFENKPLSFICAHSAAEARTAIAAHPDTAVLLLDVVMETDDAGLELVKYIRKQLKNEFVRIILKTGHPGKAPPSSAIVEYDINDYQTKVEMTQQKLIATVIFALRSYRDILHLEGSRRALQELNQNLHLLVEERTRELTEQNQNLQREIDRRQQLERDLVESNAKFKGILDIAEEAIISLGEDQRIILFNQGAERIFGYAVAEVMGRPLDILLPEGVRAIHRRHVSNFGAEATAACNMKGRREIVGLRKNGDVFPAEVSISRLPLQTGVVYTAILQDISDRKRVEDALKRLNQDLENRVANRTRELQEKIEQQRRVEMALRESEEKFRQFAETIREVFFMVSRAGETLYVSPAYEEIWGRSCQSLYRDPQSWFEAIEPDHREEVEKAIRGHIRRPKPFEVEYPIRRPDGERRWIRARSFPIADGGGQIYRFAGIAEDITDRKRDRDELQARETALRELYQIAVAPHLAFEQRLQALLSMGRLHFSLEVGILFHIRGARCQVVAAQTPPDFPRPIPAETVFPLRDTFCHRTFETSEPVGITDAEHSPDWEAHPACHQFGLKSYLGVRIVVAGKPYGTLSFSGRLPRQPFNNHELQLLQLIAMWVGGEIERQQSKASLEQEFQKTLLQQQITDRIRESIESHPIVQATVSLVGEAFEVNRCLIHRYPAESDGGIAIVAEYLHGAFESMLAVEVPRRPDNPHLDRLLAQDRAIASPDVYADPLLAPQVDLCRRTSLKSMLSVRTSYKGEPNGVITLQQCDRFREWTDDEIELIEAIARQVGIALAQASLLEREQWHKHQLEDKNRALSEATRRAEAASLAKSQFLANMSHEIRTPMNAILGFCDLLQGLVCEPRQQTYVRSIASSGKTLLALINDILDLSKIEAGKMELQNEPVDLRALVAEIGQIFSQKAAEQNLQLQIDVAEDIPRAIGFDEVRLRQILLNVVGNALKFTDSGSVTISVCARPEAGEVGSGGRSTVTVEIAVADTGIGIAPEQQQRIFESFMQSEGQSTRKYGGSGLGLAITRRLTQMLGGTIRLDSEVGRGSTFTFRFPGVNLANPLPETEIADGADDDLNRLARSTILVVDDVQSNLDLMRGYFANSHHKLLLCKNGWEAIHQAQNYRPDLILMDLRMPHLDGWEATKYLKENPDTRDIPIVILTASSLDRDRREIASLHNGFLHKPVSRRELFLALKKQLPKPPANSSPSPAPEAPRDSPEAGPIAELLAKLECQEKTVWPELHRTLKMRDLQAFSDCLMDWAHAYPYAPLVDYASTLSIQLQEFDWDKIPRTVKRFPEVRRTLLDRDRP
ncbi:PAS domain S-box protein [Lyngbya sp. CCY1209]|uniref:PAS domain S-box protein n=1 Tax=Lyngbya sp. CCY1209 TaxID=2886103 RepID=UPI002D205DA0|nr:PAS domain S-box protein [Lyngbya sp. CCY1209]MEB3887068.1 PAS domain S-box protein [Lyngbya sp. CCY1209]